MNWSDTSSAAPSAHVARVAGLDLPEAAPPVLRVDEVKEIAVVVPRSRDAASEVHLERCRADGVPVVVRPSGGGAVVLGPGTVTASVLLERTDAESFPDPVFRRLGAVVVSALADCGVAGVRMRGISDLCLGDRKIAGSALRLWRRRILYQVSVLVAPRLELMDRYLPMPGRQPDYRNGRPHREFVTSLAAAGLAVTPAIVADALRARLGQELP